MLTVLAKNPVFAANPSCLADFVKTLMQRDQQAIPTPMQTPTDGKTDVPAVSPAPAVPTDMSAAAGAAAGAAPGDEDGAIAARKQFWSKFKTPRPAGQLSSPDLGLEHSRTLSPETLVLGQEDEPEAKTPVMAQPVVPGSWVNEVSVDTPAESMEIPDESKLLSPEVPEPQPVIEVNDSQDPSPGMAPPTLLPGEKELEVKFSKMTLTELAEAIETAKNHPSFEMFRQVEGLNKGLFGQTEPIQELTYFYCTVGCSEAPATAMSATAAPPVQPEVPESQPVRLEVLESQPVRPEVPELQPVRPEVPESQPVRPEVPESQPVRPEVPESQPVRPEVPESKPVQPEVPESKPVQPEVPESQPSQPQPIGSQPSAPQASQPVVPTPAPEPSSSGVMDSQVVASAQSPPAPEPKEAVAEMLKRVNTVDIEHGKTPSPPQTLVATASPTTSTVVLMEIHGVKQPVTIPLTPEQCVLAGLTLANPVPPTPQPCPPATPAVPLPPVPVPVVVSPRETPAANPPAPADMDVDADTTQAEAQQAEAGKEPSSRQVLKNIYMRFHRSQKRHFDR